MQCQGTNKDGTQCGRNANQGVDFCSVHLPEDETCGHENLHFIVTQPDQEYAACEKELGHEGNHGALIHCVRYDPEGNVSYDEWEWQEWKDLAGTPVSQITPEKKGKSRFDVYDEGWQPVNP